MNQTERFYKIEQFLHERKIVTFQQLLDKLEISRATLKRDLQYLRDRLNVPIVYDRDAAGYRFEASSHAATKHELPGLWFNASEIHALLTMQSLLEEVQPGLLGAHIAPLQARLKSLLGSQDDAPEEVARRIRILHASKRQADLKYFDLIASTLLKRRRLFIRHYNRGAERETEREVSPQRLIYYRDNWYLDAWCHLRNEIRSFAVDAIRRAESIDKPAKEIAKRKLDAVLGAGYGIFSGAVVTWAKLRFTPQHARWVAAEQWHPRQKSHFEADGHYLLELPYANPTELIMDILRHGSGVEVLEPEALRLAVNRELAAALALYADDSSYSDGASIRST